MLNKIKVIGMFLKKEQPENKIEDGLASPEAEDEVDKLSSKLESEEENSQELWFRFSLMAWAPSGSKTTLRCVAQGEVAEKIKREVNQEEVIEVWGYLRNEKVGRQIIIKVVQFSKLDLDFENIDKDNSNQVRLIGKIINIDDLQASEILTFRLTVPREGVKLPLFFCRVNEKELIPEFNTKLKKADIIILKGFLQTQKIVKEERGEKKKEWVSSVICYGFILLDSDLVNVFNPLDNLTPIVKKVSKIDFSKPKNKELTNRQIE